MPGSAGRPTGCAGGSGRRRLDRTPAVENEWQNRAEPSRVSCVGLREQPGKARPQGFRITDLRLPGVSRAAHTDRGAPGLRAPGKTPGMDGVFANQGTAGPGTYRECRGVGPGAETHREPLEKYEKSQGRTGQGRKGGRWTTPRPQAAREHQLCFSRRAPLPSPRGSFLVRLCISYSPVQYLAQTKPSKTISVVKTRGYLLHRTGDPHTHAQ